MAADLKPIYRAATSEEGWLQLEAFAENGTAGIRASARSGGGTGTRSVRSYAYPAEIRKVIYTTNAVESLNMSLRKVIKTRGSFPNEEAALKLMCLAFAASYQEVDAAGAGLESGAESICDFIRGPAAEGRAGMNFRTVKVAGNERGDVFDRPALRFALNARPTASQGEAPARAIENMEPGGKRKMGE